MTVNELREFYGSIGRRVRIKNPNRHYTLGLDGEYIIKGYSVEELPDGRTIYEYKLRSDNELRCGYCVSIDAVEFV